MDFSLEGVPNIWHRMHSSRTRAPGLKSTVRGGVLVSYPQSICRGLGPCSALLTCQEASPQGWGSGTLPSRLTLECYLATLGSAPPCERRETPPPEGRR